MVSQHCKCNLAIAKKKAHTIHSKLRRLFYFYQVLCRARNCRLAVNDRLESDELHSKSEESLKLALDFHGAHSSGKEEISPESRAFFSKFEFQT